MADKVNLQRAYSALNERLAKLFDESGVRRSFTVPYIDGQATADHISTVSKVASQSGGLTGNLLTTAHHSTGKGWGSGDGQTVGHPVEKLRTTIIPKDDENAKAVIMAAQKYLNDVAKLLGDKNPVVQTSNSQLALVKHADGAGMNLLDFGMMMIQLMFGPTQAVAKAHSGTKEGGHAPHLRPPGKASAPTQPAAESAQGEAPAAGGVQTPSEAAPEAPAAPESQESAPAAPAPAAQG